MLGGNIAAEKVGGKKVGGDAEEKLRGPRAGVRKKDRKELGGEKGFLTSVSSWGWIETKGKNLNTALKCIWETTLKQGGRRRLMCKTTLRKDPIKE